MDQGASLALRGVHKDYNLSTGELAVLSDVHLTVKPEEFVSLVGASGCGKSTLLRLIGGLEKADGGEILLDGRPIEKPGLDRGMVFQESRLFPWIGFRELGELAVVPGKLPGIDNDPADGVAVAADVLGSPVDNDIGTMVDRADKAHTGGVIDDQRYAVVVGNF